MLARVEIRLLPQHPDPRGDAVLHQATLLGVEGLRSARVSDLVFLEGPALDAAAVERLIAGLLRDPAVEEAWWGWDGEARPAEPGTRAVEVTLLPGVTDSAAESLLSAARALGVSTLQAAAWGWRTTLGGPVSDAGLARLAREALANEVVQRWSLDVPLPAPLVGSPGADDRVESIPVRGLDEPALLALSRARRLALDGPEMLAIAAHYEALGREPTDLELEMLAQTWSEHCVHKTFKARISYTEGGAPAREVDSLFGTFIKPTATRCAKPELRSVFVDNAGIIALDDHWELAFKVETHNHPSALEPFGGANTGVGGVVRDVMGVSARPIATTDVLCFGPADLPAERLPAGVLHPARVASGVVAGIADYGNKMGIPTVNGAILYDPGYTANPLVYCGCLGILPAGSHRSEAQVGDLVVCLGGRTGRDGLRGATFSSMEMDSSTGQIAGTAVQIGHPIHEKQALEVLLAARDEGLYTAVTDCGAGGLSSAVGEMAAQLGARVHLERVPLKYPGLQPWEVWLSEAQERMVLAVPPDRWPRLQALAALHGAELTALGAFTGEGRVEVLHHGRVVGALDCGFLHGGLPQRQLQAAWTPGEGVDPPTTPDTDLGAELLALLAHPTVASKEDVVRRYDHEVQGGTVVRPFVGPEALGPADAAVLRPLDLELSGAPHRLGCALSVGINPRYGLLDPRRMAFAAVDEAVRNAVAVGADPDRLFLLDNFCWGNPRLPDRLGALVRCVEGCYDAALAYNAPFISGKDSLNNEYTGDDGQKHAIPGTLLISALAIVPDVDRSCTLDLKRAGSALVVLGLTQGELGGSLFAARRGVLGAEAPRPVTDARVRYRALHAALLEGLVLSAHDASEGGLGVALAEMAIASGLGVDVDLHQVPREAGLDAPDRVAFCESAGRLVLEVDPAALPALRARLEGQPLAVVGSVLAEPVLRLRWASTPLTEQPLDALRHAWRGD